MEFADKYGKTLAKHIGTIAYSGKLDELIKDLMELDFMADITAANFVCVPFPEDAAVLSSRFGKLNIIVLGELVQPSKGITLDNLNISPFFEMAPGTHVLLFFNDSLESELTQRALKERFPHIIFEMVDYGVSAVKPINTDEYTQYKVFKKYGLIQQNNKQ